MSPLRQLAEAFILHTINQLDSESAQSVMKVCEGSPYLDAAEALADFSGGMSVTVNEVEWIQKTWSERRAVQPTADPNAFAAEVASLVFSEHDLDS